LVKPINAELIIIGRQVCPEEIWRYSDMLMGRGHKNRVRPQKTVILIVQFGG
jgi:hypothetical protein